jgi:hypothetical protein
LGIVVCTARPADRGYPADELASAIAFTFEGAVVTEEWNDRAAASGPLDWQGR